MSEEQFDKQSKQLIQNHIQEIIFFLFRLVHPQIILDEPNNRSLLTAINRPDIVAKMAEYTDAGFLLVQGGLSETYSADFPNICLSIGILGLDGNLSPEFETKIRVEAKEILIDLEKRRSQLP